MADTSVDMTFAARDLNLIKTVEQIKNSLQSLEGAAAQSAQSGSKAMEGMGQSIGSVIGSFTGISNVPGMFSAAFSLINKELETFQQRCRNASDAAIAMGSAVRRAAMASGGSASAKEIQDKAIDIGIETGASPEATARSLASTFGITGGDKEQAYAATTSTARVMPDANDEERMQLNKGTVMIQDRVKGDQGQRLTAEQSTAALMQIYGKSVNAKPGDVGKYIVPAVTSMLSLPGTDQKDSFAWIASRYTGLQRGLGDEAGQVAATAGMGNLLQMHKKAQDMGYKGGMGPQFEEWLKKSPEGKSLVQEMLGNWSTDADAKLNEVHGSTGLNITSRARVAAIVREHLASYAGESNPTAKQMDADFHSIKAPGSKEADDLYKKQLDDLNNSPTQTALIESGKMDARAQKLKLADSSGQSWGTFRDRYLGIKQAGGTGWVGLQRDKATISLGAALAGGSAAEAFAGQEKIINSDLRQMTTGRGGRAIADDKLDPQTLSLVKELRGLRDDIRKEKEKVLDVKISTPDGRAATGKTEGQARGA